jgi:ATP phosphoribosyltransferase
VPFPRLLVKVFHEKDIPIQVAVGNYDLGICGLDWVEELLVKYPSSALVKVRDFGYGKSSLYLAVGAGGEVTSLNELRPGCRTLRLVSEYPNLAESLALNFRLSSFNIFPVWGATEVYPPENADLVLVSQPSLERLSQWGLIPLNTVLESSAFLIANSDSWEGKDMSSLLEPLCEVESVDIAEELSLTLNPTPSSWPLAPGAMRLALPDGHQQQPTAQFLSQLNWRVSDYLGGCSRPSLDVEDVVVKVIRPQDMPSQVANGNFDLAITGKDWLWDHLCRFPSSPVEELLDMKFGKVRLAAVVSQELDADDVNDLRELLRKGGISALKIVSEYVNIADKYARDRHLAPYRIIPTWGASEAFLPEDADLLIENVQTGRTIARHKLKSIDTLFSSSASLIGSKNIPPQTAKGKKIASIIETFRSHLT